MNSDFDRSDFNSRYVSLTLDRPSSLFPFTVHKSHDLWTGDKIHQSLPPGKAHLIPVEIFSEIFLYTVQANPRSQSELMLVCRHWHDIMLSTPGIHSQLRIYRWIKKKDVERVGRGWLLDVTVDPEHTPFDFYGGLEPVLHPVDFHACFMAAAEASSKWRSLALLSFPPPGQYKDLQIIHPLQHLESFKLAAGCNLGNFLEPLLNAVTTTITPRFTVLEVFHPDAALYFLQSHVQVFSSLTTLRLISGRTQNPVDVLPSLHKLEIFEAHHLLLPIYPPGIDLPLTQTLRVLHLKSVSVQWMTGQIFPALEECSILSPHYADAIQFVGMPSCSNLKYDSNNLSALEHFHISTLDKLEIKCGQWRTWSGNLQLIHLHSFIRAESLTRLHLEIKCSEQLLAYMLGLVPALEELSMVLSSPRALSSAFFLTFAAGGCNENAGPSSQTLAPLGRKLRMLHLHYKRWLRGLERNVLFSAFAAIVASHPPEEQSFSFRFSFDEGSESQEWDVHEPVERFDMGLEFEGTIIGVSSPYGVVPLSRALVGSGHLLTESGYLALPRESEYITTDERLVLPIDDLFSWHSLKEVRMTGLSLKMGPGTKFSLNVPLFHTLKVLNVWSISSSFLVGHTFHTLERYKEKWIDDEHLLGQGPLTEMPVCTRLVVPLLRLATLKLPQIRELSVHTVKKTDHIWEKHIAFNANLSGLKLLHLRYAEPTWPTIAVIKIIGSLPALETLITGDTFLTTPYVNFFMAFVPIMDVLGPSGLNQSTSEGQKSGVLCRRLESLQIEGISPADQAELMPVLKDIVTLRAIIGSPLKSFTFYHDEYPAEPQKWQLIGKNKSFMMEEVVPAERFALDI